MSEIISKQVATLSFLLGRIEEDRQRIDEQIEACKRLIHQAEQGQFAHLPSFKSHAEPNSENPSDLSVLIGCYFTWDGPLFDDKTMDFYHVSYAGIITGASHHTIEICIGDEDSHTFDPGLFADYVRQDYIRDIIRKCRRFQLQQEEARKRAEREQDTTDYDIYGLRDPISKVVYYVGASYRVELRYQEHLACNSPNQDKNAWIKGLLKRGLSPELFIIEKAQGVVTAQKRERHWIHYYLKQNAPLTNIAEARIKS